MTEGDILPENYLLEEAVGTPIEGISMTPFQEYYLETVIDVEVNRLIEAMEAEKGFSWREHWEKKWRDEAGI